MPGNDAGHPPTDATDLPADAFALVGNPLRAEIVWVLGHTGNFELSFGDLRARLDTDIEPSQLHYHLQQLVGQFVGKTDGGYRLNAVGLRHCLILRAGTFDRQQEQLSIDTDANCHVCQAPIEAFFDPIGAVIIRCSECGNRYGSDFLEIPLAAFETGAAAFSFPHFRSYIILKTLFLARGVCPSCANPLASAFHSGEGHPHKVCIHRTCDLCGLRWDLSVGRALLADPELIAFCHDHGVDILSTPFWELDFAATGENVTICSTDPWEVALKVTFDDDTLKLVVDGDQNVVERNRQDATVDESPSLVNAIQRGLGTIDSTERGDEGVLLDTTDYAGYFRCHRWPDGVTCPRCGSAETTKKGTTSKDTQRYRCHGCDRTFNDLTGTIFAERGLSLPEMFHIIRAMDGSKTARIARDLDRSYKTVLEFVHAAEDAGTETSAADL